MRTSLMISAIMLQSVFAAQAPVTCVPTSAADAFLSQTQQPFYSMALWRPLVVATGRNASNVLWEHANDLCWGSAGTVSGAPRVVSCTVSASARGALTRGIGLHSLRLTAGLLRTNTPDLAQTMTYFALVPIISPSQYMSCANSTVQRDKCLAARLSSAAVVASRAAMQAVSALLPRSCLLRMGDEASSCSDDMSVAPTFPFLSGLTVSAPPQQRSRTLITWRLPITVGEDLQQLEGPPDPLMLSQVVVTLDAGDGAEDEGQNNSVVLLDRVAVELFISDESHGATRLIHESNMSDSVWCSYRSLRVPVPSGVPLSNGTSFCVVNLTALHASSILGRCVFQLRRSLLILLPGHNYTATFSVSAIESTGDTCSSGGTEQTQPQVIDVTAGAEDNSVFLPNATLTAFAGRAPTPQQSTPQLSGAVETKTALAASLVPNAVVGIATAAGAVLLLAGVLILCRHQVLGAVLAAVAVALGTVTLVLLGISLDQTTAVPSHVVHVDVFWSPWCNESTLAPTPFRVMAVPADGLCHGVAVFGEARETLGARVYGRSSCNGGSGNSVVFASSAAACAQSRLGGETEPGSCVQEQMLWMAGGPDRPARATRHASVQCFTAAQSDARLAHLRDRFNPFLNDARRSAALFSQLSWGSIGDVQVQDAPPPSAVVSFSSNPTKEEGKMTSMIGGGFGDDDVAVLEGPYVPGRFATVATNSCSTSQPTICGGASAADLCLSASINGPAGIARCAVNVTFAGGSLCGLQAVGSSCGQLVDAEVMVGWNTASATVLESFEEESLTTTGGKKPLVPAGALGGDRKDFTLSFWVLSSTALVGLGSLGVVSEQSSVLVLGIVDNWRIAGDGAQSALRCVEELKQLHLYQSRPASDAGLKCGVYGAVLVNYATRTISLSGYPRTEGPLQRRFAELRWSAAEVAELEPLFAQHGWHHVALACAHAGGRRFCDVTVDGLRTFGATGARQCLPADEDFPSFSSYSRGPAEVAQPGLYLRNFTPPSSTVRQGYSAVFGLGPINSSVFDVRIQHGFLSQSDTVRLSGMADQMDSQTRVDISGSRALGYALVAVDAVCLAATLGLFTVGMFQHWKDKRKAMERAKLYQFRGDMEQTYGHEMIHQRRQSRLGPDGPGDSSDSSDGADDFANSIIRNVRQAQVSAQGRQIAGAGRNVAGNTAVSSSSASTQNVPTQFRHILPSLIYVWQMMSIYLSSWSWPSDFVDKIRPLVFWTTVDLRFAVPSIPDVVVPAVQVFLAVGIVFILIAVLSQDRAAFMRRYLGSRKERRGSRGKENAKREPKLEEARSNHETEASASASERPVLTPAAVGPPATAPDPSLSEAQHSRSPLSADSVAAPYAYDADVDAMRQTMRMQQELAAMQANPNATPAMRAQMMAWQASLMEQQQQRLDRLMSQRESAVPVEQAPSPAPRVGIVPREDGQTRTVREQQVPEPAGVAPAAPGPTASHNSGHELAVTTAYLWQYSHSIRPTAVQYGIRIPPSSRWTHIADDCFRLAVERLVITTAADAPTSLEACDIHFNYEPCTVSLEGHHVGKDGVDVSLYLTFHDGHRVVKGFVEAKVPHAHRCPLHKGILCKASSVHKVGNKYGGVARACGYDSLEGTVYRKLARHEPPCSGHMEDFYLCLAKGCPYAVCEECFEGSPLALVACSVVSWVDTLRQLGMVQVAGFVLLLSAQALYIPVLQTCFMILWCHPAYQCQFPGCYRTMSATFSVFAGLAAVSVVLMGVGLVVMLTGVVFQRKMFLCRLFEELLLHPKKNKKKKQPTGNRVVNGVEVDEDGVPVPTLAASGSSVFSSAGPVDEAPAARSRPSALPATVAEVLRARLPLSAWSEILDRDISMMKPLYEPFTFQFMWVQPITLVLRMTAVVPSAFSTPNSLRQLGGAAACETFLLGLFMVAPVFVDPWVTLLTRLSSIHQVAQLAFSALDRAERAVDPSRTHFVQAMLFCFIGYALAVLVCLMLCIGYPLLRQYCSSLGKSDGGRLRQYEERFQRMQRAVVARPVGDPRGRRDRYQCSKT
jgi:hypothetical protein